MPVDFTPAPKRFRVWDGERMHGITAYEYLLHQDGGLLRDNPNAGLDHTEPDYNEAPDSIVLQSTGLTDADGREVFEGDVVELAEHVGTVSLGGYISPRTGPGPTTYPYGWHVSYMYAHPANPSEPHLQQACLLAVRDQLRVIGNVYENPDLLD